MALGMAAVLGLAVHMKGLALETGGLFVLSGFLVYVAAGAWLLARRGYTEIAHAALSATTLFTIILLALLQSAVLATQARPFADPFFAAADTMIAPWLDWHALAIWFSRHPGVAAISQWIYHSIAWQPFLLIVAFCWTRRPQESWRFIGMWTLSLMACEVVFALLPGIGAYAFHHVDAALASETSAIVSSGQLRLLTKLRDPALTMIDHGCIGGIITFPSFHAVAAALLARGYWRIPLLRWPFAVLNAAMLATAIPMGGHYVVDLVAGLVVAALSIKIFDAAPLRLRGQIQFGSAVRVHRERALI